MRKGENIQGEVGVRVKILCQLTYRGYVLHQWVWGIEEAERERDSVCWAQELGGVTRKSTHTHLRTHTSSTSINSHLYLFFSCTPSPLPHFYTSPLTHSTVLYSLPTYFFSLIHVLHKISQTVSGSIRNVLLFVWLVNTEYGTLCMRFRVSLSLRGEIRFVKNDWVTGERRGASQVHYRLAEWSTPGHDGWR